jgi:hypothetical protein
MRSVGPWGRKIEAMLGPAGAKTGSAPPTQPAGSVVDTGRTSNMLGSTMAMSVHRMDAVAKLTTKAAKNVCRARPASDTAPN